MVVGLYLMCMYVSIILVVCVYLLDEPLDLCGHVQRVGIPKVQTRQLVLQTHVG
jgi:hypothetical protein